MDENFKQWLQLQKDYDLDGDLTEEEYTANLERGLVGWNHPIFAKLNQQQQEQDDYVKTPIEVEEGVLQCLKCGSKKVFSASIQTRAADEPMTTIASCTKCGTKWTQNG
jgi:DNA-directed RNA polymerase subunit M/transcription elongation factor TFIIS